MPSHDPGAPLLLAADVGGTNARLALHRPDRDGLPCVASETLPSAAHGSLAEVIDRFLEAQGRPPLAVAGLGIAGPVVEQAVEVTNLPWRVDGHALGEALGVPVFLLNDLEAAAYGMLELRDDAFEVLQRGTLRPARGNVAVVAAGTGLGEAALFFDGTHHLPMATEAGHTGFSPRDARQDALLQWLRKRHGHVSVERVVSGPGLVSIHAFLSESSSPPRPRPGHRTALDAAAIAEAALDAADPVCVEALELFVSAYGAVAGDAALRHLALGGVILAGGIAPKILPALRRDTFLAAFLDKGRFAPLLSRLRVSVCREPQGALRGVARYAWRRWKDMGRVNTS